MTESEEIHRRAEAVRSFNRFYTRQIGVLREGLLRSEFSLAEVRVLREMSLREAATASEVGRELGLDAGYLSRIVRGFEGRGLVSRAPSPSDGRQSLLSLTPEGRAVFARLDADAHAEAAAMLEGLSPQEQERLLAAMHTVQDLLGGRPEPRVPYLLRPHGPGDVGWVVQRHGALYAAEYGWDATFEALVAEIGAGFLRTFDPRRERCWIAERDGENVGSVFLVRGTDEVAKLRLLLVEPSARGLGIGRRLVEECVRFARQAGYRRITLWTNDVLVAARRIYEAAGFRLENEEPHHSFGHDLVGQTWEREL